MTPAKAPKIRKFQKSRKTRVRVRYGSKPQAAAKPMPAPGSIHARAASIQPTRYGLV